VTTFIYVLGSFIASCFGLCIKPIIRLITYQRKVDIYNPLQYFIFLLYMVEISTYNVMKHVIR